MRKRKCKGGELRDEEQIGPFPMILSEHTGLHIKLRCFYGLDEMSGTTLKYIILHCIASA